ncbi:glycosyltransferase [Caldithrix abyssi]|nr:glycosyltransferase [Caldithrix abyssi]
MLGKGFEKVRNNDNKKGGQVVIVLSMHRGGASIIKNILSKAGYFVSNSEDFMKGNEWNRVRNLEVIALNIVDESLRNHKGNILVSIVMLIYNTLKYTKKCIQSIQEHTHYSRELIIVDNGHTDGTREYFGQLVKDHPEYHLILNEKNKGFAAG